MSIHPPVMMKKLCMLTLYAGIIVKMRCPTCLYFINSTPCTNILMTIKTQISFNYYPLQEYYNKSFDKVFLFNLNVLQKLNCNFSQRTNKDN